MSWTGDHSRDVIDRHIEQRLLLAYSKVGAPIAMVYAIMAALWFRDSYLDLIAAATVAATCLIAYLLALNGIPRWSKLLIPVILCVMFAALARLDRGITSTAYYALPAFVLMIRFLVGGEAALAFALVSIAWATAMVAFPQLVPRPSTLSEFASPDYSRVVVLGLSNLFALWFAGIPADLLRKALGETEQLAQELEQRVAARTQSLEDAREALKVSNERLERTNQDLEMFARSLAHDLRAPLRTITGFTEIVLDDEAQTLSEESRTNLGRVVDASKRMDSLIDAILQLSHSSFAPLQRTRVDLAAIARQILIGLSGSESNRVVAIGVPDQAWCHGDPILLRTVLENLLSNAWKYSGREANARIDFTVEDSTDGPIFCVRDNGVGFDMAFKGKLFQHFSRLHPGNEFRGSGIGLASSRRIVERHSGWMDASGREGEGAEFRFHIPDAIPLEDDPVAKEG